MSVTKEQSPETADLPKPKAWDEFDLGEKEGFIARHKGLVTLIALGAAGAIAWFWNDLFPKKSGSAPRKENMVVINVPPPPPPPPPPPVVTPPPPPPEEKMIEQTPVENEAKPDPTPDEPPPADVATGIAGNGGPDAFGLGSRSGTGGNGMGATRNNRQASRWGWYASQVQTRVQQTLRTNRATKTAAFRAEVKLWVDNTGRVTRAAIGNSTGDPALDAALRDEAFAGMQLTEPPPEGMPMPITLRVTGRRPN